MDFKITPVHKNGYTAPCFLENVLDSCKNPQETAIEQGKKKTRLSDFDKWYFNAVRI